MLISQVLLSLAVWLVYGLLQARRAPILRARMSRTSRRKRTILGPILMVAGAIVLLFGLAILALVHGLETGSLTMIGWLVVTLAGLVFVHSQVIASIMMVSLAAQSEPGGAHQASDGRINDRNSP